MWFKYFVKNSGICHTRGKEAGYLDKWGGLRIMMLISSKVSKRVRMWAQSMTIYRTIRKWKIGFDIYYRWTTTKIRGEKKLLILLAHHQKVGWTTKYQGPSKEVYRLSATIQKNGCSIHVWIDLKMDGYLTSSILWVLKGYRIPEWYPQTFWNWTQDKCSLGQLEWNYRMKTSHRLYCTQVTVLVHVYLSGESTNASWTFLRPYLLHTVTAQSFSSIHSHCSFGCQHYCSSLEMLFFLNCL